MSKTAVPIFTTKLLYASPAWWGFATSADKQRIEALLRCGVRLNLYSALDPSVSQRVEDTDDELLSAVMANSHHVPHHMLPDRTSHPGGKCCDEADTVLH